MELGASGFEVGPVAMWAGHIDDDLRRLLFHGIGFEGDGAVGVEELVGDVGEDGGAAGGEMRPLVTRVSRRARNWRMSVPAENSESSGRRSAESSSESDWTGRAMGLFAWEWRRQLPECSGKPGRQLELTVVVFMRSSLFWCEAGTRVCVEKSIILFLMLLRSKSFTR